MTREDVAAINPEALLADGFDEALVGISTRGLAIYSVGKIIDILMTRDNMDEERAIEWFSYNIEGAHLDSDNDPIYMQ